MIKIRKNKIAYIKIGIFSIVVYLILFFIIQVLQAQLIVKIFLENNIDSNISTVFIVMAGFILGMAVSLSTSNLINEKLEKQKRVRYSIFALLINIELWVLIVLISTNKYFNIPVYERITIITKVFIIYALTQLEIPSLLFIYSGITYSIIYTFFLYFYKVEEE